MDTDLRRARTLLSLSLVVLGPGPLTVAKKDGDVRREFVALM